MENTNTNPHAGIDYIMPGEEEACGIDEVKEIDIPNVVREMKEALEPTAKPWDKNKDSKYGSTSQAIYHNWYSTPRQEGDYYRYSNSGPNA